VPELECAAAGRSSVGTVPLKCAIVRVAAGQRRETVHYQSKFASSERAEKRDASDAGTGRAASSSAQPQPMHRATSSRDSALRDAYADAAAALCARLAMVQWWSSLCFKTSAPSTYNSCFRGENRLATVPSAFILGSNPIALPTCHHAFPRACSSQTKYRILLSSSYSTSRHNTRIE
jgi:hypothetical protein